jgi:CRISPR-associated protein Cas1
METEICPAKVAPIKIGAQDLAIAWQRLLPKLRARAAGQRQSQEIALIESNPAAFCAQLAGDIASGSYRAGHLFPVAIDKQDHAKRVLLIPPVRDRLVQSALAEQISKCIDATFSPASFAYRPHRGVRDALAAVERLLADRPNAWLLDADIHQCFDHVRHDRVVALLKARGLWEGKCAWLVRSLLRAQIVRAAHCGFDAPACLCRGLPQGSPLSPLLCNLVLDRMDRNIEAIGLQHVRYADDFVVIADGEDEARQAKHVVENALSDVGLTLTDSKTRVIPATNGFRFLGQSFPVERGGDAAAPARMPTAAHAAAADPASFASMAEAETAGSAPIESTTFAVKTSGEDGAVCTSEPLLRTLYLVECNTTLDRDGGQLVIRSRVANEKRIPASRLHQVFAFGHVNMSSGAIALCLENGVPVMILSGRGKYFGMVDPLRLQNMKILRAQFLGMEREDVCLGLARAVVRGKVANSRALLRRWGRNRTVPDGKRVEQRLQETELAASRAGSLETLRGQEGFAAALYWKAIAGILDPKWCFNGRKRRPPPDPFNSLLSYGYTILYYNVLSLLVARGLNPHLGALHAPRAGHHALASDLMEEFRAPIVDALAYDLLQNGRLKPEDFTWPEKPDEPCLLSIHARKLFIQAIEERLNAQVRHAIHGLSMDWRRIMDGQVLQLVQLLLAGEGEYRPYVIKP